MQQIETEYKTNGGKFKKYKISDLFNISSPAKRFNANAVKFGGKYPYVVRTSKNNGIRDYITEDENIYHQRIHSLLDKIPLQFFIRISPILQAIKLRL